MKEQLRHKLLSRYRAHGLLGGGGGGDIFGGLGPAKPDAERPEHPGRTALREELVERGELVPVEVEGVRGRRFVLGEEVELLEALPELRTAPHRGLVDMMRNALRAYLHFGGATRLEWAPHLASERRLFLTRP